MVMRKQHRYTPEQDSWLCQHIEHCESYRHLTEMFNNHFGTMVGEYSLTDRCIKRLHIHRNANTGRFQNGMQHGKMYKIGDERIYGGYIWVKVDDVQHIGKVTSKQFRENWIPKHRYVYESAYGKIPDGYIVVFLDRDRMNFSVDNLCCIPRKISAQMSKNNWFTTDRELTLCAIRYCELLFSLKSYGAV